MKFKILILLFLPFILLLSGCKNEEKAVTGTAAKFLDCLNAKQYDKARKLATPESKEMLDFMQSMASLDNNKPKPIEDLKCRIANDTAHCTYVQEFNEKTLDLVKVHNKWLVDMKKESPDYSNMQQDSSQSSNKNYYQSDTITYFDVRLLEAKDTLGAAHLVFDVSNRSEFNILHLWMTCYFSDKEGKFLQKKDMMFNGVLKNTMYENISNSDEIKKQAKIEVIVDNCKVGDIGEIFIYPFRIQMEAGYYENSGYYGTLGDLYSFAKRNTLIKNLTNTDIKIVF